jgi:uncharacterized membrane protein YqjE
MADDNGRSIGTVLKDIVGNVQQIVRSEIRLASVEVREEAGKAGRSAALVVIGGAIAVLALGCALIAAISALSTIVALWSAARIVAAVAGVVGAALIATGMKRMRQITITPTRTLAALEENIPWAKAPTR